MVLSDSPWSSLRFDALTSLSHIADFFDSFMEPDFHQFFQLRRLVEKLVKNRTVNVK